MRFEPNLSTLFTELPLLERPGAAAAAGFEAAELWWPFDEPDPASVTVDELARAFEDAGITLACLNFYGGDFPAGARGTLSVPRYRDALQANIGSVIRLAERLRCTTLNTLYGNQEGSHSATEREALAMDNLVDLVEAARTVGARVVVEALNPIEFPTYGLHRVDDVIGFLDRARDERDVEAWCSFDMYHAGCIGDSLPLLVERHADRFGHVQIADVPARIEPGMGTIDFTEPLGLLSQRGYSGWIGLEYTTTSDSHASLRRTMERLAIYEENAQRV
jgi:hydroxypyruvate isomerase